jgi:hypothetical protein
VNANADGLRDAQCHVSADSLVTVRAQTQYAWFISEDLSIPFRGDASSFSEISWREVFLVHRKIGLTPNEFAQRCREAFAQTGHAPWIPIDLFP